MHARGNPQNEEVDLLSESLSEVDPQVSTKTHRERGPRFMSLGSEVRDS